MDVLRAVDALCQRYLQRAICQLRSVGLRLPTVGIMWVSVAAELSFQMLWFKFSVLGLLCWLECRLNTWSIAAARYCFCVTLVRHL